MKEIEGGVCAAKGFSASGVHCGIRKKHSKKDLALIVSKQRATAAAVYTQNLVKGAPIAITKKNIVDGYARAVICNSGNANTCNADGEQVADEMCKLVEQYTGVPASDVVIASTGVIGQSLQVPLIKAGMPALVANLGYLDGNALQAAEAILTTDTFVKQAAVEFALSGVTCHLGGMAKGSGMIHPNMATLLVFLTTDAAVSHAMLQKALQDKVKYTFNMVSVDRDTSTNDMVSVLANGLAGNPEVGEENDDYAVFAQALESVMEKLCRMIAKDGEGASKLLECTVSCAKDETTARICARGIISSTLFKAAMYGSDANWGRVLCAIGYSGAEVDIAKIDVSFASQNGSVTVCKQGAGVPFSETQAKTILSADEIRVLIDLHAGEASAVAWGCDLTHEYVDINSDYRS